MIATASTIRRRLPISDFDRFGHYLYDRFNLVFKYNDIFEDKFTFFLNLFDHGNEENLNNNIMVYAGIDRQRQLLGAEDDGLDDVWKRLKELTLTKEATEEGGRIIDQFIEGDLSISDLRIKSLKRYFSNKPRKDWNKGQVLEYKIIKTHFNLESARFLSYPIIQFGDFDGVAHLIFDEKEIDRSRGAPKRRVVSIKRIIRSLSKEFEDTLWLWNLDGKNIYLESWINSEMIDQAISRIRHNKNPILTELDYVKYYKDCSIQTQERIRQNNEARELILTEHRRRAIIAILIDSYAHNISAHSLTILKWWFEQRAGQFDVKNTVAELEKMLPFNHWGKPIVDFFQSEFPGLYDPQDMTQGVQATMARWYDQLKKMKQSNEPLLPVRDQLFPLAPVLTPLLKFLLEKGAFWSGVTRDEQFGGEIRSLFNVLWYDFIDNPLYLGTIAYSEGIKRLNIRVRIYDYKKRPEKEAKDNFTRTYYIDKDKTGELLDGVLAVIDVGGDRGRALRHNYVEKGPDYGRLQRALNDCSIFLPGGVVGKHAFFTIIENEIRNVKHFDETALDRMRKDGLSITIGIRPSSLGPELGARKPSLYKVGVWIHHKTRLQKQEGHLVLKRLEGLEKDIITKKDHRAKLGGNQQDKICAAMLFNNSFISVQNRKTEKDKKYYPWIRGAFSKGLKTDGITEDDFEVRDLDLEKRDLARRQLDKLDKEEKGYFKKYFHLWQGASIYHFRNEDSLKHENIARFKIVKVADSGLFDAARREGVIRVVEGLPEEAGPEQAYESWLWDWLKMKPFRIILQQGKAQAGFIIYDTAGVKYYNNRQYDELDQDDQEEYADYEEYALPFAHNKDYDDASNNHIIRIRSHGKLATTFFNKLSSVNDLQGAEIKSPNHACELAEVLRTNILIMDKRIASRIGEEKKQFMKNKLLCNIHGEDAAEWKDIKQAGLDGYHFVILHLSFIEALINENTKERYGEKGILEFIENEILKHLNNGTRNFFLVITTGRGRTQWLNKLKESKHIKFTIFRPVESLIEAVEGGSVMNDDFDIKYNLVKVLIGS